MATIKNAKKQNFELKKIKIKDGKVIVDYVYKHDENPDSEKRIYPGVKIPLQPHPDLISLFGQLREYVLREFYIEPTTENLAQVKVNSISLSGEDEKLSVVISSNFDTLHAKTVALNTSSILLSGDDTGLEAEIDVIVDSIIDETFNYLFKGKRADPTLFQSQDDSKKENEDEKPKEATPDLSGLNNKPKLQKVG